MRALVESQGFFFFRVSQVQFQFLYRYLLSKPDSLGKYDYYGLRVLIKI
jgi:hypothetical protein